MHKSQHGILGLQAGMSFDTTIHGIYGMVV